ncbi:hypothetical protein Tco_0509611 [Tanacetum coccineum]
MVRAALSLEMDKAILRSFVNYLSVPQDYSNPNLIRAHAADGIQSIDIEERPVLVKGFNKVESWTLNQLCRASFFQLLSTSILVSVSDHPVEEERVGLDVPIWLAALTRLPVSLNFWSFIFSEELKAPSSSSLRLHHPSLYQAFLLWLPCELVEESSKPVQWDLENETCEGSNLLEELKLMSDDRESGLMTVRCFELSGFPLNLWVVLRSLIPYGLRSWLQGSGPAELMCFLGYSDTGMLTPDVTVDESISP